jgi:hypothetical protein
MQFYDVACYEEDEADINFDVDVEVKLMGGE